MFNDFCAFSWWFYLYNVQLQLKGGVQAIFAQLSNIQAQLCKLCLHSDLCKVLIVCNLQCKNSKVTVSAIKTFCKGAVLKNTNEG